jgi:hypothetical protein
MPTAPRPSEGAGLELGIVRTISPAHGGVVRMDGRPVRRGNVHPGAVRPTRQRQFTLTFSVGGTRLLTRHQAPHPNLDELDVTLATPAP